MGMYTGLRGYVRFKKEYVNEVSDYLEGFYEWHEAPKLNSISSFREFSNDGRCGFIPNGAVCYMPDDWGNGDQSFKRDTLKFTCSLKNYNHTIEKFLACLPEVAYDWVLEVRYEEAESGTMFVSGRASDD